MDPDIDSGSMSSVETEREIVSLSTVGDPIEVDRRNDVEGLEGVPGLSEIVGRVDASADASTQTADVIIDESLELDLDTFVMSAQRLTDGSVLFHYGLVTEVSGRIEGAEMATDTARLAAGTLPGQRYRRADVYWLRTYPERYLPPASGAPVWEAQGEHRRRALFLDKMISDDEIPIGLDMNDERVYFPYSFLNGEKGAHVSISGKSGIATKTSYALFLLYMLFETEIGKQVRGESADHDRAVIFSVKGEDLLCIDKPNAKFLDEKDEAADAGRQWSALIDTLTPGPFKQISAYAPAKKAAEDSEAVPEVSVRRPSETRAYGWSPVRFILAGLLQYVFEDLESGQYSLIEQSVRLELLRWAWPVEGDDTGKVVFCDPENQQPKVSNTWDSALEYWHQTKLKSPKHDKSYYLIATLDDLVKFIASKVNQGKQNKDSPSDEDSWTGKATTQTKRAFVRRLFKALPRLRRLVSAGLDEVDLGEQVSVVDIHALHTDAQRFVVACVLARVWDDHEDSTERRKTFVVLDELNKYAPRSGGSPIKHLLVDIATRGRSLGVILIGAQQSPSGVHRDITNNASLEVVGQINYSETSELGFLPPKMQARAQIIPPGTMITNQPLLPAPIPIRFPFPPYATRKSEIAEPRPADDIESAPVMDTTDCLQRIAGPQPANDIGSAVIESEKALHSALPVISPVEDMGSAVIESEEQYLAALDEWELYIDMEAKRRLSAATNDGENPNDGSASFEHDDYVQCWTEAACEIEDLSDLARKRPDLIEDAAQRSAVRMIRKLEA